MPVRIVQVDELQWLHEALASAWNQTLHCEVVVWDDGSTLDLAIVKRDFPATKWHGTEENKGVVAARNAAIEAAKGPWILPLDHDDQLEPEAAEVMLNALAGRQDAFAYSDLHFFGPGVEMEYPTPDFDLALLLYVPYISVSALYPKDAWRKAGGYDARFERGFEDWAFAVSLALNGYAGVRAKSERPLLWYRFRPGARRRNLEPYKSELLATFRSVFAEALRIYPDPRRKKRRTLPERVGQPRSLPRQTKIQKYAGDPDGNVRYIGTNKGTISVYGRATKTYYSVSAGRPLLKVDPADYPKIVARGDFVPYP